MIAIRLLVVVACLCAFAPSNIEAKKKVKRVEDVFCDGKGKFEVYLKKGKDYLFETAMKPKKNTKCVVHYKLENGCSNVVIDQVQYSLNDEKSCYKRIKGSNKKGKGEAQVDFCGAPSGEGWEHDATTIGTDPNDVHMHTEFGDSTSWPLAIDEDFTIIFTQKVASGSHMKHRIRCTEGLKEPELAQGCRCGMMESTDAVPALLDVSWRANVTFMDNTFTPAVLISDRWIVTASSDIGTSVEIWKHDVSMFEIDDSFKVGNLTFYLISTSSGELVDVNDHPPVCMPTPAVLTEGKIKRLRTYGHQYDKDMQAFDESPVDVSLKVLKREKCEAILAKTNRQALGDDEECVVPLKRRGTTVCEPDVGNVIYHTDLGKDMENYVIYGFVIELGKAGYCATKKHPARIQKISQTVLDKTQEETGSSEFVACSPNAPFKNCIASNGTEFFCPTKYNHLSDGVVDWGCCGDQCGPTCSFVPGQSNTANKVCIEGSCECEFGDPCGAGNSCCAEGENCVSGACQ